MQSATFESALGGADDEFGDGGEVSQFEKGRGDPEIPIVLVDLLLEDVDAMVSPGQAAIASNDPDVIPHETPNFIPVLGDDHGLMAFSYLPVNPLGEITDRGLIADTLDGFLRRGIGEDQCFEQGIGCQAICAVQARAGHFPGREEIGDIGFPIQVGSYATATIMGSGDDGDGVPGHVDAELQAMGIDIGEATSHEAAVLVGDVEGYEIFSGSLQLIVDRPGDDIPRSQVSHLVRPTHEGVALPIPQDPTFTSNGFADEE